MKFNKFQEKNVVHFENFEGGVIDSRKKLI